MSDFTPTHRHYKGGLYQVLHIGADVENQHDIIIYKNENGRVFSRHPVNFFGTTGNGASRQQRFVFIKKGEKL